MRLRPSRSRMPKASGCGGPAGVRNAARGRERGPAGPDAALGLAETALWLAILGEPVDLPTARKSSSRVSAHRLHITGRWREAAEAWRAHGLSVRAGDRALGGDEAAQREALGAVRPPGRRARPPASCGGRCA